MKKNILMKILTIGLAATMLLPFACACTGTDQQPATEPVTQQDWTSAPATDAVTDAATESATEAPNKPVDPGVITFYDDPSSKDYLTVSRATCEVVTDRETGKTQLKLTPIEDPDRSRSSIAINYASYMRAENLTPLTTAECRYVVVKFRVENGTSETMTLYFAPDGGAQQRYVPTYSYNPNSDGWQYAFFDLSDQAWKGKVGKLTLNFSIKNSDFDEIFYIDRVSLIDDYNTLFGALGMGEEQLGSGSSLTVTDSDPVTHGKLNAPDEDGTVDFWFDRTTEKTPQSTVNPNDRYGYTVQMAKNEIEDCQFFLAPKTDRTFRVELSVFTDEKGNKLDTSLFFDYYHDVKGVMTPDAIPPVQGPIAVKGGQSQGFLIKVKTTAQTVSGLYSADLKIYDENTGKCVKVAKVYTDVWNFALSDETVMRTAMQMLYWKIYHSYPEGTDSDTLAVNYYDFLLENRICAQELPFGVRDSRAPAYLDNPRVNSFSIPGVEADRHAAYTASVYDIMSSVEGRLKKAYFYRVDEPTSGSMLENLAATGKSIEPYFLNYRMVSPFFMDIDYGGGDMVEFMKPYTRIWCTKINAFTPRKYNFLKGMWYLQSEAQDAKYGEFSARMEAEKAEGDEVWTYFCFEPVKPYANWMATCDGTEPEITFWQCKLLGINGVLFWGVDAWTDDMYGNIKTHDMGEAWGDGILIYSGAPYGIQAPVSSLRLESIRDGIEDYQMLCMLEELCGKEAAEEYIRLITTSVINYTDDDDTLAAVRAMLGERLEKELNK